MNEVFHRFTDEGTFRILVIASLVVSLGVVLLGARAWLLGERVRRGGKSGTSGDANEPKPTFLHAVPAMIALAAAALCLIPALALLSAEQTRAFQLLRNTAQYETLLGQRIGVGTIVVGLALIACLVSLSGSRRLDDLRLARNIEAATPQLTRTWLRFPTPRLDLLALTIVVVALTCLGFGFALTEYAEVLAATRPFDETAPELVRQRSALGSRLAMGSAGIGAASALMFLALYLPALQRLKRCPKPHEALLLPGAARGRSVLKTMIGSGIGLAACWCLSWLNQPLKAENQAVLPDGYGFANDQARLPKALLQLTAPHAPRLAPVVELSKMGAKLDGSPVATTEELRSILRGKRDAARTVLPELAEGKVLRVTLQSKLTPPLLREWLTAISRAGYTEIDFASVQVREFQRPVLGRVWGYRETALRTHLAQTRAQCEAHGQTPIVLLPSSTTGVAELTKHWLKLAQHAQEPCLVAGAAICDVEEPQAKCLERLAVPARVVSRQEIDPAVSLLDVEVGEHGYDVVLVTDPTRISIWQRAHDGERIGGFERLEREMEQTGRKLLLAMNAGMFEPDFSPVGLLVSHQHRQQLLNLNDGDGNFYMKPNGVFAVAQERVLSALGLTTVETPVALVRRSEVFDANERLILLHATQSGPLLLEQGKAHPKLDPDSTSIAKRNAVGMRTNGDVYLVATRDRVSLYALTTLFTHLGVSDALYLDGNLSTLFFPEAGLEDKLGSFGPLLAVSKPQPLPSKPAAPAE